MVKISSKSTTPKKSSPSPSSLSSPSSMGKMTATILKEKSSLRSSPMKREKQSSKRESPTKRVPSSSGISNENSSLSPLSLNKNSHEIPSPSPSSFNFTSKMMNEREKSPLHLPPPPSLPSFSGTIQNKSITNIQCKHLPAARLFYQTYFNVMLNINQHKNAPLVVCSLCGSGASPIYACLQCVYWACWHKYDCHLTGHNTATGHALAIEMSSGVIYCVVCKVWIWDRLLDRMKKGVMDREGKPLIPQRASWQPKTSLIKEIEIEMEENDHHGHAGTFIENSKAIDNIMTGEESIDKLHQHCIGVRGLYNLGATCFMNSVLQTCLHNPFFIRAFLNEDSPAHKHRETCYRTAKGEPCIVCTGTNLFYAYFNGGKTPLSTHKFLETMWKMAPFELVGYEQQDAHEFFVALRNSLHTHLEGHKFDCRCLVHRTFSGVLQSDVRCQNCHRHSETFDPFLDISLDIFPNPNNSLLTLRECLARFTREETLQMKSFTCAGCNQSHAKITKQMSIRMAPLVLTLQLKRFDPFTQNSTISAASLLSLNTSSSLGSKLETLVSFPVEFDIGDFMTPSVHQSQSETMKDDESLSYSIPSPSSIPTSSNNLPISPLSSSSSLNPMQYILFAVIAHVGNLDSGHYTSFVKYREEWFWLDDALVTKVSEEHVLNSPAYMLFYLKKFTLQN